MGLLAGAASSTRLTTRHSAEAGVSVQADARAAPEAQRRVCLDGVPPGARVWGSLGDATAATKATTRDTTRAQRDGRRAQRGDPPLPPPPKLCTDT